MIRATSPAPSSTYRLQLSEDFTLFDAADLVDYVAALGAGALYISPVLQATRHSAHGYDVVDHQRVDEARGGQAGLRALATACRRAGLGLVVDIVPNHMGVADPPENRRWWELLAEGRGSEADRWFDVDWPYGHDKVLLPVLGDEPAPELGIEGGVLCYGGLSYPLREGSVLLQGDLAAVLGYQHYELVRARRADVDQNYRRFFAVTSLAGIRVEDPQVFAESHREILSWVGEGLVSGLRIDHPDGLVDPGGYLTSLAETAPGQWLTVEKILAPGEHLAEGWPVAGTTGYDALAEVNGLMIDPGAEAEMDRCYRELTGDGADWATHFARGKALVATTILRAEVLRLARLAIDVPDAAAVLEALAVAFPVYRSYLPLGERYLGEAVRQVSEARPELATALATLVPRLSDPADELAERFQQLTGAVMAKGIEDTAFYRYSRFIALNEVGASPGDFGLEVEDFHRAASRRAVEAPHAMTTLSTHDTKRGEDVRARLAVLAELAGEWRGVAARLLTLEPVPNRALGYLLWQTVVAVGLIAPERLHSYLEKAMREAGDGTSWREPNAEFEGAMHGALDHAYERPETRALVTGFAARLEPYGRSNGLSQKLVQLTMPGVPDLYQGSELAQCNLVDPDNRRPVDFAGRRARLARLGSRGPLPDFDAADHDDRKLFLTATALRARRDRPELFRDYRPLRVAGTRRKHLVAFDRGGAITLATRLPVGLERAGGFGEDTITLPAGRYREVFSATCHEGTVALARVLGTRPVALLLREEGG